ncbi:MAG TPA: PDZ domain-containing protein [Thermoanaerobaculia bacterium]|nr:PDZ domain-containing protein [Thermoanaerobaculia bacterium]
MRHRFFPLFLMAALASAAPTWAGPGTTLSPERPAGRQRVWLIGGPRAFLGVTTLDITPELRVFYGAPKDEGVVVASVASGSPASSAGVHVGDVITRVDGHSVSSPWELADELGGRKKGDRVSLDVVRDRSPRKLEATLAEREAPEMDAAEGMLRGFRGPMLHLPRVEKWDEMLRTPEWEGRLDGLDECERVRKRLETVEERLKALEQKLPKR